MRDVTFTPEQKRAVYERGGGMLVSAGAGSGKTRVLVERLLERVCDPDDPKNVDDFLIITYTKAAAAELRGRILKALTERLRREPDHRHLRRQLARLPGADISTIHSFCRRLLEERGGVRPDTRLLDTPESDLLRGRVLEETLDALYEDSADDPAFTALLDTAVDASGDRRLKEMVLTAYEKARSHPEPAAWMARREAAFFEAAGKPMEDTVWGRILLERGLRLAAHCEESLRRARADMRGWPGVERAYGAAFDADIENAGAVRASLARGWNAACAAAGGISFGKLGQSRNPGDKEFSARCRAVREGWKKGARELAKLFDSPSEALGEDMAAVAPVVRGLFDAVRRFSQALQEEKERLRVMDFSDLEHEALALLTEEGSEGLRPSGEAARAAQRYEEVMVDEYQDISRLQECLVHAISRDGRNVFLVGDVRQSIYRFRLAEPALFLEKYNTFPDRPEREDGPRRVLLNRNFRSRPEVLDAVNRLFAGLMSVEAGEMAYTPREYLQPGGTFPAADADFQAELLVVDLERREEPEEEEESLSKVEAEAAALAERLKRLLDEEFPISENSETTRAVRPEDIVILMRAPALRARIYDEALTVRGIPCRFEGGGDFFSSPEIMTALAFLSVIDNSRQDIPLLAVMRCPVYGFDTSHLARLRMAYPDGGLYGALRAAAETGDETAGRLLADLSGWRLLAPDLPVHALLGLVYEQTGLPLLYGAQGRRNLLELARLAVRYENGAHRGLFSFLGWSEKLSAAGEGAPPPVPGKNDAVRIMSIHRSKGLEFPVVALADCAKRFNETDARAFMLFHPELGVGVKRRDNTRMIEYPAPAHRAVAAKLSDEMLAEEMRVLYVAMTRAREKLILSAALPSVEAARRRLSVWPVVGPLPPQLVSEGRSYADWLFLHLAGVAEPCVRVEIVSPSTVPKAELCVPETEPTSESSPPDPALVEDVYRKLSYVYPHSEAVTLPSKLTATSLKGRQLDGEVAEASAQSPPTPDEAPPHLFDRPRFVTEATGLTAAERGAALHLFLQWADFNRCARPGGTASELARLCQAGFLTAEQAESVDTNRAAGFFGHPLGQRILASNRVSREFKFSLLVPAEEVTKQGEGEEVLLQGVVDCFFEEPDGLVVVDFKTDLVRPGEEEERAQRYLPQVHAYARALADITGKPVKERWLYFFRTGTGVTV